MYNNGDFNQNDVYLGYQKLMKGEIENSKKNIIIHKFYRSPFTCLHEFQISLNRNCQNNKHTHFFLGDFNIDIKAETDFRQVYLNSLGEYGYILLINKYTRILNTSKSLLHQIFIKIPVVRQDNCNASA